MRYKVLAALSSVRGSTSTAGSTNPGQYMNNGGRRWKTQGPRETVTKEWSVSSMEAVRNRRKMMTGGGDQIN